MKKREKGGGRESFVRKRGDISPGDETTNPRRELHLHRRTDARTRSRAHIKGRRIHKLPGVDRLHPPIPL